MVALKRFASSRGFVLETDSSADPNLLTLFVPAVSPAGDRIPNLKIALRNSATAGDKSFFLQLLKIDKNTVNLERDIDAAIRHIEGESKKYAFLIWNNGPRFWLLRNSDWKQAPRSEFISHLAKSQIKTYQGSPITVEDSPEPNLIFKKVRVSLAAKHIVYRYGERRLRHIDFSLDLRRGVFSFEGISKVELFADKTLSQALFRGDFVEGSSSSDIFGLRSRRDIIQIFDRDKIVALQNQSPSLGFLVQGELDLFPYDVSLGFRSASLEIQKRSKVDILKPVATEKPYVDLPVNQHDTLGNNIQVQVGRPDQSLRFIRAPQQLFQDRGDLDVVVPSSNTAGEGSVIIPAGVFPIAPLNESPLESSSAQSRRLKLGVSNTEVVNIAEKGVPAAALYFLGEATEDKVSITSANEQPAFLRRTILDFSDDLELEPKEIEDFRTGELLSASTPTIWAHIAPVDPDGKVICQGKAAIEQGWQVSSQADELVQFEPAHTTSITNATETLNYQLDDEPEVVLSARKVLFVKGAVTVARPRTSTHSSLMSPRLEDPIVLQNETLARYRLQQRTKQTPQIARLRGTQGISVTPQGFELIRTPNEEVMSLAKSINIKKEISKFSIKFKDESFRNLMRQNQFFLVLPAKYSDASEGAINSKELFDLDNSIQISDWGFSLDLANAPGASSFRTRDVSSEPILVLKYKKGTLYSLLHNKETWDNYSQENYFASDKVESTDATIKKWVEEINPAPEGNVSQDNVDYHRFIRHILYDPDWVGTLLIYPQIDLDNMPEGLAGLASGMELDRFRSHHIGFNQNKIELSNGDILMKPSSFFGLVGYHDGSAPEKDFSFKVHELKVLFGNSEVKGFDCLLKVKLAKWFGEDTTLKNDGAVPQGEHLTSKNTLWIKGRYESLLTEASEKINKYSFIHDRPIELIGRLEQDYEDNGKFFQKLTISYLEFKTLKSEPQGEGKRSVSSKIIIDADAKFKKLNLPGIKDIINFESIEMDGISLDFTGQFERIGGTWKPVDSAKFWPEDLNFDAIAIDASLPKLRPSGLLANFPLKFEKFHLLNELSLPDIGFSNFGGDKEDKIKFGLQFRLDLGSLGRLIGFDSSLVADLLVGWNSGDTPSFAVGLRFPDNGGRSLNISLGPVTFTAGYFDMFESVDSNDRFIALTDFRMDINGFKLPPKNFKSGILLTPAPDQGSSGKEKRSYYESMGWLAGFSAEKVAFLDKLILFVSQRYRYTGPADRAQQVVSEIEDIITLNLGDNKDEWEKKSKEYREKIDSHFSYDSDYEWFIGAGATFADSIVEGYAVYNPPGLYGGEGSIKDFLSLSIMYQQTTPRLGVYTATLKFADKISRFSVGAVTIQLPWVMMKMDTDGGYLVNVGLNLENLTDYSNAGAAEFGIFTGSAGVVYGKISGSALRDVPLLRKEVSRASRALPVYTPVTRLTLSGKFGIGRSLDEWPMFRGGAHVSIYGILSGTWGKFSSIELKDEVEPAKIDEIRSNLPSHYHKYWAEIGILAEIWGVIDFAVTRFGVNVQALIGYGVSFETLKGTTAYARALISISIRWVLFRIKVFGKKIEVAIQLSFKQEFRKTYVLARPNTDVPYDQYFTTSAGVQLLRENAPTEYEDYTPPPPVTFNLDQSPSVSTQKLIKVLPLFDYVRNDNQEIVAVPILNLPYGDGDRLGSPDTGHFKDLLGFVIDWSFSALKINEHLSDGKLNKALLRGCAQAVASLRLRSERGEWSAVRAKAHLNTAFQLHYLDPSEMSAEFEQEPRGATVFFTPHNMTACQIASDGSKTTITGFANREVPSTFLNRLDTMFEDRHIRIRDSQKTVGVQQSLDIETSKLLEDFLFEEYLESILRAVWALLSERLPNFDMKGGLTPAELKRQMLEESPQVSMRVNRQFFSGNRIPIAAIDPNSNDVETLPLPAARSIEIEIDPNALPAGIELSFDSSKVVFETDNNATDAIRDLLTVPINFGQVTAERKLPFIEGAHEGLALIEQIPVSLLQSDSFNLYTLPGSLKNNISYRLDKYHDGEHKMAAGAKANAFKQVALIRVPVLPVEGASDLYQIERMPEESRRSLGLMQLANIDFSNPDLSLTILQSVGDNKEAFSESSVDLSQSFILRTNLSKDPNPTSLSISSLARPSAPIRAHFQPSERHTALSILWDAAETNSGGYMMRLKGFEEPDKQELTLMIVLPEVRQESLIPPYIHALLLAEPTANVSTEAPLMLRQVGKKAVTLGTPGVLELEVKRPNPENQYQSLKVPGLRISREQAVREHLAYNGATGLINSPASFDRFLYSSAADRLLENAGVEEVNLSSRYNLLAVSIEQNDYYAGRSADLDLPVTPMDDEVTEKDLVNNYKPGWVYYWSVSAARLVNQSYAKSRELFPDQDNHFIYGAVGSDMKVKTQFRDIMGYTAPGGEKTATLLARYYDPLIAPGALAGMKSSHDVVDKKFVYTLSFDAASLNTPQDQQALNLLNDELRENTLERAATIMRCMQQLRDRGTKYEFFSTLGFRGGRTQNISESNRRKIYRFLKECYQAVVHNRADFSNSLRLEFSLSGNAPSEGFALYCAELIISREEQDVHEKLLGGRILEESQTDDDASNLRSEVIEKRIELPIADEPALSKSSKEERLANAIKDFLTGSGRQKIIAAISENAKGKTLIYILDAKMLELTPMRPNSEQAAAFAAFEPLATSAKSEVGAAFWDWTTNKREPQASDQLEKVTISNFDMDTAFSGLLHEVDHYNTPDQLAPFIGNAETSGLIVRLARAREELAERLSVRHVPIYDNAEDALEIKEASYVLNENLSNSLKRRISRFYGLDTILIVPLAYSSLPIADDKVLLYGNVEQGSKTNIDSVQATQEGNFLPAALRRNGSSGRLCIQFDVANAGISRMVESPLFFNIEYVRVNFGSGDVGTIDPDNTRWLKLFEPRKVTLAPTSAPANIPVLFKSLPKSPVVSVTDSQEQDARLKVDLDGIKEWSLVVDVERKDQVAQDETYLDIEFNTKPETKISTLNANPRSILSILYEYSGLAGIRGNAAGRTIVDDTLWIKALVYWTETLVSLFAAPRTSFALDSVNFESATQHYVLSTKNAISSNSKPLSTTLLEKIGSWDSDGLSYELKRITSDKRVYGKSDNQSGALARVKSEYDPKLHYQGNRITVGGLNLMLLENAWPSVWVKRNKGLSGVADLPTNDKFVYTSSKVRTGDHYTPSIRIEVGQIFGATLKEALHDFMRNQVFNDLINLDLGEDSELWPTIDLMWSYESGILDELKNKHSELSNFQPEPIARSTAIQTGPDLLRIAAAVDASVGAWLQRNPQAANHGRIEIRMTVFSRLLETQKQLLRMEKIQFPL
ncbi:hypothetical protein ACFSJ3_03035 [Corallincola platygyrae]|uniref:Uncharacterized protein n=1 Tax=Corallincola platygyrae TaxID=1193278 RepID=A0ABW4XHJ0_9GAMM